MSRPTITLKTPGAAPQQDTETDADALVQAAPPLDGVPEPQIVVTQSQIDRMVSRAVQAAMAPRAQPQTEANLPDQSEIDPRKITTPTLSKQGYVIPLAYGEPADPSIKR